MRAAWACAAACRPAEGRVDSAGRHVRPASLPRQAASADAYRDGAPLARLWARFPAAAAPELAQHRLAEEASLVRGGPAAGAAPPGAGAGELEQIRVGWNRRRRSTDPVNLLYRSEEHTSELQSLMRISYAVFCLKKKTQHN